MLQLAERYYRQPGLARRLDSAMPPRYQRPKEADLTALLQAGELDYAWTYRSLAETNGLRYVSLPTAIDLSDPALAKEYETRERPRARRQSAAGRDSLTLRGRADPLRAHDSRGGAAPGDWRRLRAVRPFGRGRGDPRSGTASSCSRRRLIGAAAGGLVGPEVSPDQARPVGDGCIIASPSPSRVQAMSGIPNIPLPSNEPILSYAPGSPERAHAQGRTGAAVRRGRRHPGHRGGEEIRSGDVIDVTSPHSTGTSSPGRTSPRPTRCGPRRSSAIDAQRDWAALRFEDRAAVFLRAAEMLATTHRALLNGATMLGQSKTAFQAEIDSACELIDFFRFNVAYAERLYREQPESSTGVWNRMEHRPLEGFVYAVTPFNFTAIGGNLPGAPALMGNTAVWKPSHTALLSNYYVYKLLEHGRPAAGRHQLRARRAGHVHRDAGGGAAISPASTSPVRRPCSGRSGTRSRAGSTSTCSYPRIVGETGGKDFVVAHQSADPAAVAVGLVRGAYEYQGQKCSAASRAYIPDTLWPEVRDRMVAMMAEIKMGDVADFRNFMGAVIDKKAFDRITGYLDAAKDGARREDRRRRRRRCDSEGWFIQPTLVTTEDPTYRMMCDELFGPVLTVHVYPGGKVAGDAGAGERTSPYALTGAVFARDRAALAEASQVLRQRGGQFLPQRQAHRRGGGPAAVRRRAGQRHQRQGRIDPQPGALGLAPEHQGDARVADGLPVSVHGSGVKEARARDRGNGDYVTGARCCPPAAVWPARRRGGPVRPRDTQRHSSPAALSRERPQRPHARRPPAARRPRPRAARATWSSLRLPPPRTVPFSSLPGSTPCGCGAAAGGNRDASPMPPVSSADATAAQLRPDGIVDDAESSRSCRTQLREVTDLASALDDLLPRLPPEPLQVGEEWRSGDTLAIKRLSDSAGLQRYHVQLTRQGPVPPPPATA